MYCYFCYKPTNRPTVRVWNNARHYFCDDGCCDAYKRPSSPPAPVALPA